MPKYFYIAKSQKGEEKTGYLEAKDTRQLARALKQEDFILVRAEEEERTEKKKFGIRLPFFGGVSLQEKIFFTRNLRVMVNAGISLPRALGTLSSISRSEKFKKTISAIVDEINKGRSFSETLFEHPDVFSEIFCNMVRVGEESGTLESVLKNVTSQMEREHDLKSKVRGAMLYPAVILLAMVGIGVLMMIIVVPKLAETFEELGVQMPLTTRIIVGFANLLVTKWYLLILIIIFIVISFRTALKTEKGKKIIDKISLKIPIVSSLVKKLNSAYTTRTLGSLVSSGVPIVRSLEIVSGALGNFYFKSAILESVEKVKKGEKLSQSLKEHEDLYSPIIIQMMEVGEETGETSDILEKLADFYEEEVTAMTKNMASIVEPVLMLIIGAAVGFFAVSMLQPMYSMLGAIE